MNNANQKLHSLLAAFLLVGGLSVVTVDQAKASDAHHAGDYGTTYETKDGSYVVRVVSYGYEWETSNGKGGVASSKRKAKKAAKAALAEAA